MHNNSTTAKLYYIHDPMCSWCWGFHPVWRQLKQQLPTNIEIIYLLGGLAPDSQEPMPEEMQQFLQQTWRNIQQKIPGTEFNFDFWTSCQPRRSTYPACRAVIATKKQNPTLEDKMILRIQQSYYLEAKNPSDDKTLIELAEQLDLNTEKFKKDLNDQACQIQLAQEIKQYQTLGTQGFPSLVLIHSNTIYNIKIDYLNYENMLLDINKSIASSYK